jgi:non-heme chloroperoxidase
MVCTNHSIRQSNGGVAHLSVPSTLNRVEVDQGIKLFYQDNGAGQAVVLVHGLIEDYRAWDELIAPFSRQYMVVAYSRRFAVPNKNPGSTHDDTVENNVADLVGLIKSLNLSPVHLVGHSYGGLIAANLAYRHPELLRSLILIEPAVLSALIRNPNSTAQRLTLLLTHPSVALAALKSENTEQKGALKALKHGDQQSAVRILVDGVQGRSGAFEQQFSEEFRKMAVENATSIYAFETDWYGLKKEEIRQISVPTCIVRGENTSLVHRYIAHTLRRLLTNSEEVAITGSGHFIHHENPEELTGRLLEFLTKHSHQS